MKISQKIARCAVFGLTLAASAMLMHAQETKAPEKKKTNNAPQQHAAPPAQQRHDAAPPAQAQRTPPSNQPVQHQVQQAQPRSEVPVQTPQTHQAQPNRVPENRNSQPPPGTQPGRTFGNQPENRNPQPAPGAQPGRTFGNQPAAQPGRLPENRNPQPAPGAQPGRTFGNNPPGRGAEPPRGQPQMGMRPGGPPPRVYTTGRGDVIHRDSGGRVQQVRMSNGTVVYHPPNAPRRVEVAGPGGRMVVAGAPGHGYVQRPVVIHNTTIIKRTYVYNGVPQARIYRPRMYNGVTLAVYTPVRYYRPTFYSYAYNPWARPVSYTWGWGGRPWYGYYGGYFTPYPVYASPSLWLTDYLIAATLESAYQERMASRSAGAGNIYQQDGGQSAPMTPEVKQAIADEVRRQIDRERAEGQTANGPGGQDNIFADNVPHVFVVHATFAVNSNAGECTLGEGDVLQMNGAPPMNSPSADVMVLSSRGRDCRKGSRVSVALQDLQEMYNQMLATIDRGMGDLQAQQGQGGLPTLPQGSTGTIDSPFAQEAQPDSNVASELTSVSQEADRAEQQAVSQAGEAAAPTAPTLSLDMTVDDVKAIQGEPQKIVDLGSKKIYVYKDLKITFTDGRVSDIQ